jgi:transcriptional regulator with GAF, ATPase, and Fis domain
MAPLSGAVAEAGLRLIGGSPAISALEDEINVAAQSDAKVLITGETGVGKELVARLIHQRSRRASAPLITLNCAGLPDTLLESELFGHVRGSFTGAYRDKPGLLEMAPHGTVFLDEVGETSARMQAVLLRFLESGETRRVGADRASAVVDTRLITATNRDLTAKVRSGGFREDLYFRLNVIRLAVPPLRERARDIAVLVTFFLRSYAELHRTPELDVSLPALRSLAAYAWPGNVRELRNVVERLVLKAQGTTVELCDLPAEITGLSCRRAAAEAEPGVDARAAAIDAQSMADLMLVGGVSFWSAVYPSFMSRDLTRSELRKIVQIGLESTGGNYRMLVERFNMPADDYKRFLQFLRRHDCQLSFQSFRSAAVAWGNSRLDDAGIAGLK